VCLDTYPPIFYMNDTSRSIVRLISNWNAQSKEIKVRWSRERASITTLRALKCHANFQAAYTFDAGPNAVVYVEQRNAATFAALVRRSFPSESTYGFLFFLVCLTNLFFIFSLSAVWCLAMRMPRLMMRYLNRCTSNNNQTLSNMSLQRR
jgi:hypothetical protein